MKKKRLHKPTKAVKPAKDTSKHLSWWIILPAFAFISWGMEIGNKTIFDYDWWWFILCFIIGFTVGIVRLVKDKEIVWNWKEYLGGFVYSITYSAFGIITGLFVIYGIEIGNYYIPTDHPYYNEPATVLGKIHSGSRYLNTYYVEMKFENKKFGTQTLSGYGFYNQAEKGDKYILTLQNGFFHIPVIKDKAKQ